MESLNFGSKKLGFGCMRLPMTTGTVGGEGTVDTQQVCEMVDAFLAQGFCYFDTAHGYIAGHSEPTLRQCLVERYPRDRYLLTDKLSGTFFQTEAEIRPFFESQLEITGAGYFDFYLMHALSAKQYQKFTDCSLSCGASVEGRGKNPPHGNLLPRHPRYWSNLSEHRKLKWCKSSSTMQIWKIPRFKAGPSMTSAAGTAKPVIVMEPVKGGALANLPEAAGEILDRLQGGSRASYAIRFARLPSRAWPWSSAA